MTANQINYAKLREESRHNLAGERLSDRANDIAYTKAFADQLNAATNARNAETNLLTVQLRQAELNEKIRSNLAAEAISTAANVEKQRANIAAETLQSQQLSESARHNESTERQAGVNTRAGIVQTLISTAGNLIRGMAH